MSSTSRSGRPEPGTLRQAIRAPGYPARVIARVDDIHRAPDVPGVMQAMHDATAAMSVSASLFVAAIPEGASGYTLKVLLACDPRLGYASSRACPIEEHPWFAYAKDHQVPVVASRLKAETTPQRAAVSIAQQHGFASALIVPVPCGRGLGRFSVLCLGSRLTGDFEARNVHLIRILARSLAAEMHEWFMNEDRASLLLASGLRPRDLRLLALVRRGLGTKEIARHLGLSHATVDSQFQRLNARLGCRSRRTAARRAAEYGLID